MGYGNNLEKLRKGFSKHPQNTRKAEKCITVIAKASGVSLFFAFLIHDANEIFCFRPFIFLLHVLI